MGWLKEWRLKRARRLLAQTDGQRDVEIPDSIIVRADGFIPDSLFTGGTLEDNLNAAVWSFAAITANAEAVASLPAIVQRRGVGPNEPDWVRLPEHPLYDFLRRPLGNTYSGAPPWSWQKLFEVTALQVELAGNSFWLPMDIDGGRRLRVQVLAKPERMKADEDGRGYPLAYRYPDLAALPPVAVCNIQAAHPSSSWKGVSVFQAALRDITIDKVAHRRTMWNLANRIGGGLILKKDGWFGLTDEEKKRTLAWIKAEHQATNRDGMPFIIGKAWDVDKMPPEDPGPLIFETRKLSRDGIMAVTKCPPTILGIYENATLQNFNISRVIWWTNKLFPLAGQIYTDLNQQLVWPRYGFDVRLWYDVTGSPIGLTVVKERAETAAVLVEKLGYPANAASAHVGLGMPWFPDLDKANTHLAKAGREPEPEKEPDPDEEAKAQAKAELAAK